jgi:hypothetical protein
MALASTSIIECNAGATAGNVNGGGFNPANAGMLTDLTTDSNTANTASPVVSSASYNFAAGDDEQWLFIKSGTNWTPGFYQIASVSGNKATLRADVGEAVLYNSTTNELSLNTVAGCATVGTPTNGTFTIDYSQSTAAIVAVSDFASVNGSAVITSATAAFTPVMVGNFWHLASGTNATAGWYELTAYTSSTQMSVDRDCAGAADLASGVGKIGGAMSLGGADDDAVFELAISSTTSCFRYFFKGNATFTMGAAVSISGSADGDSDWPVIYEGYDSKRTDRPTGSARPLLDFAANAFTLSANHLVQSLNLLGTAATFVTLGSSCRMFDTKVKNISTTANRNALSTTGSNITDIGRCELISYRGAGLLVTTTASPRVVDGCYIHHCDAGISTQVDSSLFINNTIIEGCVTDAYKDNGARALGPIVQNCTLYGSETPVGTGLHFSGTSRGPTVQNTILYGFATGVTHATLNKVCYDDNNNYYNNTSDVSDVTMWRKGPNTIAVDPDFTDVVERSGSTATTTAGNHLVQTGATFQTWNITPGRDYLYLVSGTGVTAGIYGIASVDSETQITTDVTLTANATANKVWRIVTGHNFLPTGAV